MRHELGQVRRAIRKWLEGPTPEDRRQWINSDIARAQKDLDPALIKRYGEVFSPLAAVIKSTGKGSMWNEDRAILHDRWAETMAEATLSQDKESIAAGYRLLIDYSSEPPLLSRTQTPKSFS